MADFDWLTPPKDRNELYARSTFLVSCDVLQLVKIDPRDEVFETLLYWHPKPVDTRAQIEGVFGLGSLAQTIVADLIDAGLVLRSGDGDLRITTAGLAFTSARLVGPDINSIYRVREKAPSYAPLSDRSSITLKALILQNDPVARYLIKDVYHPVLGRVTFDEAD